MVDRYIILLMIWRTNNVYVRGWIRLTVYIHKLIKQQAHCILEVSVLHLAIASASQSTSLVLKELPGINDWICCLHV